MDHHWALCVRLEGHLGPLERLLAVLVCLENFPLHLCLLRGSICLFGAAELVPKVEPDGQLEVELDRAALNRPAECILDLNVDLRAVECTIALLETPGLARLFESLDQLSLRLLPQLISADRLFGPRRQLDVILEAEESVDAVQELEACAYLVLELIWAAEHMRIVLLEPAHPSEARERPSQLIAVQNAEISDSDRQVPVAVSLIRVDEAVPGAVHRLEPLAGVVAVLGRWEQVQVVLVVREVP